jgi:hypothetical protein
METIKAFFREAGAAVSTNLVRVVREYPYSAGVLVLIGYGAPKLLKLVMGLL